MSLLDKELAAIRDNVDKGLISDSFGSEMVQKAYERHNHTWCFGGDARTCTICTAHLDALQVAISAQRPFSNILRGDIRTFNYDSARFGYAEVQG